MLDDGRRLRRALRRPCLVHGRAPADGLVLDLDRARRSGHDGGLGRPLGGHRGGRLLQPGRTLELLVLALTRRLARAHARAVAVVDVEGREELGVEVPRRESEAAAAIVPDDDADVGRPQLACRARKSVRPVVVRRDGERPAAEVVVHLAQVARRGAVDAIGSRRSSTPEVTVEEPPPGGRHELPDAGRPDLRVGVQVEARLDQRHARQLDGESMLAEDALHLRVERPPHGEPAGEALLQAALAAQLVHGGAELVGTLVAAEEIGRCASRPDRGRRSIRRSGAGATASRGCGSSRRRVSSFSN